ncbi:MAG: hypothetical protein ACR2PY_08790, partial [Salinispira sp.]
LNNKLNLLEDRYSSLAEEYNDSDDTVIAAQSGGSEFYSSALGRYVSMLVYRADGDVDGARIDAEAFSRAFRTQPTVYDFPQPDIDPLLKNSAGTRINVLAFAGRIPEKRASVFFIRTFEDRVLILVQKENNKGILETTEVESFGWPGMTEGYQFTFELPFLRSIPSRVERVELVVDGLPAGDLDLIENLGNVSAEVYRAKEAIIYVKTITRTILKGLLNQELKSGVTGENALLGTILGFFTDIAVHASEEADLRSARYYPSLAFAGEFSIDPGRRSAALNYYDASDNLIFSEEIGENDYRGDGLNLMYAYVPW